MAAQQTPANHQKILKIISGLLALLAFGWIAWWVTQKAYAWTLPFNIPGKVLEYPLWGALVGLVVNVLLKRLGVHTFLKPGFRTELLLKVGLVLLGASVNLSLLVTAAGGAIIQGVIMITSVFFFGWWLGGKFGLDDKLRAVMSTALAVCGVSAAIAAAGSVMAKKEQVTYVTGLVILVALPMMVITPLLAGAMGLSQPVAGAWFGGNIDTTAAVVGAGTIYGAEAQKIASIVKSAQNALIGVVAFLLALYFATREKTNRGVRPNARMIWDRFPKFVLGFVVASVLYTLGWVDGGKGTAIAAVKDWAFLLAFVSMGIEFSVQEFKAMGWKPVAAFLIITLFNTALALGVSWVLFGWLMPL